MFANEAKSGILRFACAIFKSTFKQMKYKNTSRL